MPTDEPQALRLTIRAVPAGAGSDPAVLEQLVTLLRDAVEDGASVGFLAPLTDRVAIDYWRGRLEEVGSGRCIILGAWEDGEMTGTVQLWLPSQQNGAHRAEVQRLIVRRAARGRGVGSALMAAVEDAARAAGRTLLLLNTRRDDGPERLYRRLGYVEAGQIPEFARNPDGSFNTTTIMYRHLDR
jgi:ribosomal protein S18 acetylase RimI-like enzyme